MATENINILLDTAYNGKGVKGALSDIQSFESKLGGIAGKVAGAANSVGGLGGTVRGVFGSITGTIGGAIDSIGQFGRNIAGIKEVAATVIGGITALTSSGAQFETFEGQLSVFLGSTDAAKERLKELAEFGASTPFELPQLVEAEKKLLSYIGTTENALDKTGKTFPELRSIIGDTSASIGVDFGELTNTIGKFSTGATGEAIARLQELGIVTKEQLTKVGIEFDKGGALTSPIDEALTATISIMQEKFGGGSEKLAATFEGQISTMRDSLETLKRGVTQPIFEVFKAGLTSVLPVLGDLANRATAFGEEFSSNFRESLETFQDDGFGPVSAAIGALGDALSDTVPGLAPLGDALTTLAALGERVAEAFGKGGLEGVLSNLPDIIDDLGIDPAIGDSILNLVKAIQDAFASLGDAAGSLEGKNPVAGIIDGIAAGLPTLIDFAAAVIDLVGFIVDNRDAILEFGKAFLILKSVVTVVSPLLSISSALGGLVAPLATLAKGTGVFATAAAKIGPIISTIAGVLGGPVTIALASVAALFLAYKTNFLGFGDAIDGAVSKIKEFFSGFGDFQFPDIGAFFASLDIGESLSGLKQKIVDGLSSLGEDIKGVFAGVELSDVILLMLAPVFGIPNLILEKLTGAGIAEHIKGLFSGIDIELPDFLGNIFGGDEEAKLAGQMENIGASIAGALASSGDELVGLAGKFAELGVPPELGQQIASLGQNIENIDPGTLAASLQSAADAAQKFGVPPEALEALKQVGTQAVSVTTAAATAKQELALLGSTQIDTSSVAGFVSSLSEIDISSVLTDIGSKFANLDQFISFDIGKLAGTLFNPLALGEAVNTFFVDASTSGEWSSSFGETLGVSLEESLTSIGVYLDGAALGEAIDGVFASLNIDTSSLDGILEGVGSAFAGASDAVSEALSPIRETVDSAMGEARDIISSIQDSIRAKVQEVWNAIPADIREDLVAIASILKEKYQEQVDTINEKLTEAKEAVNRILDEITGFFDEKFARVNEITQEQIQAARDFIDDKINEARDIFDTALGEIERIASDVMASVRKSIEDALGTISDKIGKPFADAAAAVKKSVSEIATNVKTEFDKIRSRVDESITNAKNAAIQRFGEIVSSARTALQPIIDAVRGPFEEAVRIVSQILATLKEKIYTPIRDAVTGIPAAVKSALGSLQQVGTDIIDGISRGITAAGQKLKDAAIGVLRSAVQGLRNFLESFSPSRLTERLHGIPFGQGIAVGILATQGLITSAATSVMAAAADAVQSALPFEGIELFAVDELFEQERLREALAELSRARDVLAGFTAETKKAANALPRAQEAIRSALEGFFDPEAEDGLARLLEQLESLGVTIDEGFFSEAGLIDAQSFEDVRVQIEALADEPERQRELWDLMIDGLAQRWGAFYDQNLNDLEKQATEQKKLIAEAKKAGREDTGAQERLDGVNEEIAALKEQNDLVKSILDQQTFSVENQFKLYERLKDVVEARAASEEEAKRTLEEIERKLADAIRDRQDAAEELESAAFEQTIQLIEEEEERRQAAHEQILANLEEELRQAKEKIAEETAANEEFHKREIARIKEREEALQGEFDAADRQIDLLKSAQNAIKAGVELSDEERRALEQLGIDPQVAQEAVRQLERQKTLLEEINEILKDLPKDDRARTKVTTAAGQAAIDEALATAQDLSKSDRRILEVAAAGREVNTKRLREILERVQAQNEETIASQEQAAKEDPIQQAIDKLDVLQDRRKRAIDDEKAATEALLDAEEARFQAEQDRISTLTLAIEERIERENQRYDAERENLERIKGLERERHDERMRQIEEQYALELLRLGKSEEEVLRILEEQRKRARDVAEEAARRFQELLNSTVPPALPLPENPPAAGTSIEEPPPADLPPPTRQLPPPAPPAPPEVPVKPIVDSEGARALSDSITEAISDGETDQIGDEIAAQASSGVARGLAGALQGFSLAPELAQFGQELARSFTDPTSIALDELIRKATFLRTVLSGVAGLGPVGGDVTIERNLIFNGPVTIDQEVADSLGIFDVSRFP